jgi:phosphonate transport system substrate-binding protein
MSKLWILVFTSVLILSGCSRTDTDSYPPPENFKPLVIGLIPEQNLFRQLERYKPLSEYLYKKTGVKIELKILPRYGNIIDNFNSLGMDGAFFGSFTYALAKSKLDVEVLARPEKLNGKSGYKGYVFVRVDSGIKGAKQMKGRVFVFVDKATTAGYLLPLAYFKKNGIRNYKAYFKETYFAGTHEDAIYDVLNKKADIGAAKNTIFKILAQKDSRIKKELLILEKSSCVPENALALKKEIDPSIRRRLLDVLLNMHEDPEGQAVLREFGARRFIVTEDKDYEPVFKYAREIGLDLATYDYMN